MKHLSANIHGASNFLGSSMLGGGGMLDVNTYRPFTDGQGNSYIMNAATGKPVRTNDGALLRYDEWKDIDQSVVKAAVDRLVGIADLQTGGLTHNLGSIGVTISQWEEESDMTDANMSMSGITEGDEDTPAYNLRSVPVPIIHKDFRLNIRRLEASRRMGESLDVTASAIAGRKVAEKSEDMLFSETALAVDGNNIYGYLTLPERNEVQMDTAWTSLASTAYASIISDVQDMLQAARNDNYYGPFMLYVPGAYETLLDSDYNVNYPNVTIRDRIKKLHGIKDVRVVDRLIGDNIALVQMTRDVVDLAIANDVSTMQWETKGGWQQHFKSFAVWVPRLKSDYDGKCGIVHLRTEAETA